MQSARHSLLRYGLESLNHFLVCRDFKSQAELVVSEMIDQVVYLTEVDQSLQQKSEAFAGEDSASNEQLLDDMVAYVRAQTQVGIPSNCGKLPSLTVRGAAADSEKRCQAARRSIAREPRGGNRRAAVAVRDDGRRRAAAPGRVRELASGHAEPVTARPRIAGHQ